MEKVYCIDFWDIKEDVSNWDCTAEQLMDMTEADMLAMLHETDLSVHETTREIADQWGWSTVNIEGLAELFLTAAHELGARLMLDKEED